MSPLGRDDLEDGGPTIPLPAAATPLHPSIAWLLRLYASFLKPRMMLKGSRGLLPLRASRFPIRMTLSCLGTCSPLP